MQKEITAFGSSVFLTFCISGVDLDAPIFKSSESNPFLLLKCLKIKPSDTSAECAIDLVEVALKPLVEKSSSDFFKINSFFVI